MSDRIEEKIDTLANAVASGFKELRGNMEKGFDELRGDMEKGFGELRGEIKIVDQKVDSLRSAMIEMSYDYKKLIARVEKLELSTYGSVQE